MLEMIGDIPDADAKPSEKTDSAIQTLETNLANHLYPEPSPWPLWISTIVDYMHDR